MSRFNARPRKQRSFGHFEALESRLAMAGNITSSLAAGALGLTGDDLANNLRFESNGVAGEFLVTGLNDAATNTPTLIDGLASKVFSNVTALQILLNGGNDQVLCKNFELQGLTILGGAGDDQIEIGEYVPLTTPNPSDNVQTIGSPQNLGQLRIDTQDGAAVVRINYLYGNPYITIDHSSINESPTANASLDLAIYVAFSSSLNIIHQTPAAFDPTNTTRTQNTNDLISVGYVSSQGSSTIRSGSGNDLISVYCSSFRPYAGAPYGTPAIQFFGNLGTDYIALDVNIIYGPSILNGNEDSDTIQFSRNVGGSSDGLDYVTLTGGAGDDTILVGKYYGIQGGQPVLLDSGSKFAARLTINMDDGNDTAIVTANIIHDFVLGMGFGNDYAFLGSNTIDLSRIYADVGAQSGYDRVRRYYNAIADDQEYGVESSTFGPPL
jgi:hypothetical protein